MVLHGILPLNVSAKKSVALIGPCTDDPDCNTGKSLLCMQHLHQNHAGDYNPQPAYIVTPRAAFTNRSGLTVNDDECS